MTDKYTAGLERFIQKLDSMESEEFRQRHEASKSSYGPKIKDFFGVMKLNFNESQQDGLQQYVRGNQVPDEGRIAEILGIFEEDVMDTMELLGYEQCQGCGCWVSAENGVFAGSDFVCNDCLK